MRGGCRDVCGCGYIDGDVRSNMPWNPPRQEGDAPLVGCKTKPCDASRVMDRPLRHGSSPNCDSQDFERRENPWSLSAGTPPPASLPPPDADTMSGPTSAQGNNIKVVCRFRPMNRMERDAHSDECIHIDESLTTVRLRGADAGPGPERDGFTFDRVFAATSAQVEIFDFGVKGIVHDVMMGFNGTLFCYGQTGSGKTFTMMGADIEDPELKGLVPRITQQIFASIAASDANVEYTVKVSYMEIYMERIRDLLAPANDNLSIHEDKTRGVYVKGLTDVYVGTEAEVYAVMKAGGKARAISATNMNAESSRSHSIFVVGIHQRNVETGSQKSGNLYLVDLAGSEKVGKTGASGQTLEEAKKINKSLSALGMVINNLTDGKVRPMLLKMSPR